MEDSKKLFLAGIIVIAIGVMMSAKSIFIALGSLLLLAGMAKKKNKSTEEEE